MKSKSADIYVFSGSGNTFLLAKMIKTIFDSNDCPTTLYQLPCTYVMPKGKTALGIAVTTAFFSTYPFVIDFLKSLPDGRGREVFLLTSLAGKWDFFGMDQPIRSLLLSKNYIPIGFKGIRMPSNYGTKLDAQADFSQDLINEAVDKAANFAGYLLTGKSKWSKNFRPFSNFFFNFVQTRRAWNIFKKINPLVINNSLCIKCGLCSTICPVGAIETKENIFYINKDICVDCQHCACFCPESAISVKGVKGVSYQLLKYSDFIKEFKINK